MAGEDAWSAIGLPQQASGGDDISGPYDVVENWPENACGEGYQGGSVGGVFAETPDRVFVFQRGCLPVLENPGAPVPRRNTSGFDLSQRDPERHPRWDHILMIFNSEGELVDSWEQHNDLFVRPHRVKVSPYDPERHVWVIDDGAHSVYKFTSDGELVMTLGEFRVPGDDETHFNRVTDIAWLPEGDFYISDGYNNTPRGEVQRGGRVPDAVGRARRVRQRNQARLYEHGPRDCDRRSETRVRFRSVEPPCSSV